MMASPWYAPSDPTVLPPAVSAALRAAQAAENAAVGAGRRPAFRFTRALVGGTIAAGYAPQAVASVLGVSTQSVRGRIEREGWLPEPRLRQIVGLRTLNRWQRAGFALERRVEPTGETSYAAQDVVRALAQDRRDRP